MADDGSSDGHPRKSSVERTQVSWIVLHPDRRAVLVTADGGPPRLPSSSLEGEVWLGDAPAFVGALSGLGLDAALLGCRDLGYVDDDRIQCLTMLATPRPGRAAVPSATRWAEQDEVADLVPADVRAVRPGRPPWEAPDWLPATEDWLRAQLAGLGRAISGRVVQQRSWELSSLLQAPTSAGPVWLKASAGSDLFADEGAVMALVSGWFPAHVPAPLSRHDHQRLLLLEDFGPAIGRGAAIDVQERVLAGFGGLQTATADRLSALRSVGLADRGPAELAQRVVSWFPALGSTASIPSVDRPSWLTGEETATLQGAVPRLVDLCSDLAAGPVPLTLLHGDLHLNNVAGGPGWGVVFDWTDACIGHPFFDLVTALHGSAENRIRQRDAYLSAWTDYASPAQLRELWRKVEILAPLHHAVSYAAIASACAPPVDPHMALATADWLRWVITALAS